MALISALLHLVFAVIFTLCGAIKKGKTAILPLNILAAFFNFSLFFAVLILTEKFNGTGAAALLFSLAVFFLLSIPVTAVSFLKSRQEKEDRAVSDIIDAFSVNTENGDAAEREKRGVNTETTVGGRYAAAEKPIKKANDGERETDFSHVKNVMERLNYVDLTDEERVETENLKALVMEAEKGDMDDALKRKLNEGLAFVIKIMAKYEL